MPFLNQFRKGNMKSIYGNLALDMIFQVTSSVWTKEEIYLPILEFHVTARTKLSIFIF